MSHPLLASRLAAACALLLFACTVTAREIKSIPIVTQVQGATFYRTSVTISNGNPTTTTALDLMFSYRSPVDGTFQVAHLTPQPLGPHRVLFYDDMIQALKNAGVIRAQDAGAALFGTLLVTFDDLVIRAEAAAVARTYSPDLGEGGTLGIAYAGRCYCSTGSLYRALGSGRSGVFGNDGSTRANLGIINEGFGPSDVRVTYYHGGTGAQLKQFLLSDVIHRELEENEVYQLNNIFADSAIPADAHTLVIQVEDTTHNDQYISAYLVQLDNTTNDGSFFFLEEEDPPSS
jgi:hypothetical protein